MFSRYCTYAVCVIELLYEAEKATLNSGANFFAKFMSSSHARRHNRELRLSGRIRAPPFHFQCKPACIVATSVAVGLNSRVSGGNSDLEAIVTTNS